MIGVKRQYVGFADRFSGAIDVVCCGFTVKADMRW